MRLARVQAVVEASIKLDYFHVVLDGRNGRQETLTVEAISIKLTWRLVRSTHHHQAVLEQRLQQTTEQHGISNIRDKELIEAQYTHLASQLLCQRNERIGSTTQLKLAPVHPTHKVVEVLPSGRHREMAVKAVHQPGLAAPYRSPEIDAGNGMPLCRVSLSVKRLKAGIESCSGNLLRRIGGKPLVLYGCTIKRQGRESRLAMRRMLHA